MNKLTSLQPDAYSRFYTIKYFLEKYVSDKKATYKILDIGGSSTFLYKFLELSEYHFEITIIDPLPRPAGLPKTISYIQASAEDKHRMAASYDFAIMIDVLEHLPSDELKQIIVTNAVQVASKAVLIAGPFDSAQTDTYEHKLNNINKEFFGVNQNWLAEHFEYGKPNLNKISKIASKMDWHVQTCATLPMEFWLTSSVANLVPGVSQFSSKTALVSINQAFNTAFAANIEAFLIPEGYREFLVMTPKEDKNALNLSIVRDVYKPYTEDYSTVLTCTIINSQKAYQKVQIKLHLLELSIQRNENIKKFERDINAAKEENKVLRLELERQLKWRNKIESLPVVGHALKIKKIIRSRNTR